MPRIASYALSLLVLLAFLGIGRLISTLFGLPIPGSVIGMILLAVALGAGIVRERWVAATSELLLRYLALLFVPPGVGLMLYFGLLQEAWVAIGVSVVVSTIVVLLLVGSVHQRLDKQ
jgi:holin-like protein